MAKPISSVATARMAGLILSRRPSNIWRGKVRFAGPVSYASLPFEGVDWAPFDVIATDAGYRDAATAHGLRERLREQTSQGKPFAEFGCTTHRRAADLGGRGESIVERNERARPVRTSQVPARAPRHLRRGGVAVPMADGFGRAAAAAGTAAAGTAAGTGRRRSRAAAGRSWTS